MNATCKIWFTFIDLNYARNAIISDLSNSNLYLCLFLVSVSLSLSRSHISVKLVSASIPIVYALDVVMKIDDLHTFAVHYLICNKQTCVY